jgi:hypothetical protein
VPPALALTTVCAQEAERQAADALATEQARTAALEGDVARERERTSAAEAARLDAARRAEAADAEAARWRSDCDRVRGALRKVEARAQREAADASAREAYAALPPR